MMQGSEDRAQPLHEVRAQQEGELAVSHALTSMEYALAREAFHVGSALRAAGIGFDPLTFVALRILEVGAAELEDPSALLRVLAADGSLDRTVALASDLLAGGPARAA